MSSTAGSKGLAGRFAAIERAVLVTLLLALVVLAAGNVILRTVGLGGAAWTDEIVRLAMLWVAFLGGAAATRERAHIHVDLLERRLSVRSKAWFDFIGAVLSAVVLSGLAWVAVRYVASERTFGERTPNLGLPLWIGKAVLPVAIGIMAVRFITIAREDLGALRSGDFSLFGRGDEGLSRYPDHTDRRIVIAVAVVLLAIAGGAVTLGPPGALVGIFLAFAFLGAPLFVVLGTLALVAFTFVDQGRLSFEGAVPVVLEMARITESPVLLSIPMFTLAGAIMAEGRIGERLVRVMKAIFGPLPGGIAVAAVAACVFFAALSGSSAVTILAVGALLAPALRDQHGDRFTTGLLTASGALGILVPPSLPLILYGVLSGADIQRLFIAGTIPTLLTILGLFFVAMWDGRRRSTPRPAFDAAELGAAIREGAFALALPVVLLGSIYGGVLTAAEASVLCVLYAVVVEVWVHRALPLRRLPAIVSETGVLVGSILVIVVMAMGLTSWLTLHQIPDLATTWVRATVESRGAFLLALNVLLLGVGALMDIFSALVVVGPLVVPIAAAYGVDPVHLGIIMVLNLEIGFATPPFGINLFIASRFFRKPISEVFLATAPFLLVLLFALALTTWVPALSLMLVPATGP